jgi:dihydrolipoamide dehydrogenase
MNKSHTEIIVIGAGPGGYAAAFTAADHGKKVVLVDMDPRLGGVCLNRGCIPSKALLNAVHIKEKAAHAKAFGLQFEAPKLDLDALRNWKNDIITKLSDGVSMLASKRGVTVIRGKGYFESNTTLRVETETGQLFFTFDHAIIAVGSRPTIPAAFDLGSKRVMTSTEALEIEEIPATLLVVGGGYIGMELGTVYAGLGSAVTVVEAGPGILSGADADLARPVIKYANTHFKALYTQTKITKMATHDKQIKVTLEGENAPKELHFDKVLVSIGRTPNSKDLGLENANIKVDEKGFIQVNKQQQTSQANIWAIGDIAGGLLLAHKASKEAKIAVEALLGSRVEFNHQVPAVVFTHPEIAWCGLTESEAKAQNIPVKVAKFPWGASGRAMTLQQTEGLTKLIIDPQTDRILGAGIVGEGAGELIGEAVLAIEMGANATDLAETIHAHPTLSETLMESAEVFFGTSTHLYSPKKG